MTASAVAAPPLSRTVIRSRSTNRTRRAPAASAESSCGRRAGRRRAGRPAPRAPAASRPSARRRTTHSRSALLDQRAQRGERVEVGRVVADVGGGVERGLLDQAAHAAALVELHRRAHLEDLAAPVDDEAGRPRPARGDLADGGLGAPPRPARRASGSADHVLVLGPDPQAAQLVAPRPVGELADARRPLRDLGVELGAPSRPPRSSSAPWLPT